MFLIILLFAYPAEKKRRAEEAHQSAMPNGTTAENGGSNVSFSPPLFYFL